MGLLNILKGNSERSQRFKEVEQELRIQRMVEQKQKSSNERELERFVEEQRQEEIKGHLQKFRQMQQEEQRNQNPLKAINIFNHKPTLMKNNSNLLKEGGTLKGKKLFFK